MRFPTPVLLVLLGLVLSARPAQAHRLSTATLRLEPRAIPGSGLPLLAGRLDLPLRDLVQAVDLDANADDAVTWGELKAAAEPAREYLRSRLHFAAAGRSLPLRFEDVQVSFLAGEPCASFGFTTAIPAATPVHLEYRVLHDLDPEHRCLLRLGNSAGERTRILGPDAPELTWLPVEASASGDSRVEPRTGPGMAGFVREGVHHIAIGFDHILFLLALLLPAVLRKTGDGLASAPRFGPVAGDVLKVVTAFTAAHSITLALAAFDVIRLPSRLVETVIAASVVVAAANNLVPFFRERGWWVAFGFGLVHGFGFAGVLADLDLPRAGFALALVGFNVGVELGQLAIVAAFLPVAFVLRDSWVYRRIALQAGSAGIAGLAALWVVQRALGLG